jgi:hypothetical protein
MSQFLESSFQDQAQRKWTVRFDGRTMRLIQEELNKNICDAFANPQAFMESVTPAEVIAMVWISIRDDARGRGIDEDAFLSDMWGEALLRMNDAFWGALVNFSQPPEMLPSAKKLLEKTTRVLDKKRAARMAELDALSDEQIEKLLGLDSTESSLNSVATAEPTRTKGRTAK